ncbi:MAG: hypothetical protein MJA83_11960 [Gammaproteobacteria bacterium]|nr:hypothetical protein [Gammaproteobacteria bacterium]
MFVFRTHVPGDSLSGIRRDADVQRAAFYSTRLALWLALLALVLLSDRFTERFAGFIS